MYIMFQYYLTKTEQTDLISVTFLDQVTLFSEFNFLFVWMSYLGQVLLLAAEMPFIARLLRAAEHHGYKNEVMK